MRKYFDLNDRAQKVWEAWKEILLIQFSNSVFLFQKCHATLWLPVDITIDHKIVSKVIISLR